MLGKEIKETYVKNLLNQKNEQIKFCSNKILIEKQNKKIIVTIESDLGQNIVIKFNSANKKIYAVAMIDIWLNEIENYTIVPEGLCLEPSVYWNIYKRKEYGKSLLQGTGYTMFINEKEISFVPTNYYFQTDNQAVYGIYDKDELLYIGSTSNYPQRWSEHYLSFYNKNRGNKMYQNTEINPDELEFKILYNQKDIAALAEVDQVSMYEYETVEKICIEHFKPKYNIEGITMPFKYQATRLANSLQNVKKIEKNLRFSV